MLFRAVRLTVFLERAHSTIINTNLIDRMTVINIITLTYVVCRGK